MASLCDQVRLKRSARLNFSIGGGGGGGAYIRRQTVSLMCINYDTRQTYYHIQHIATCYLTYYSPALKKWGLCPSVFL